MQATAGDTVRVGYPVPGTRVPGTRQFSIYALILQYVFKYNLSGRRCPNKFAVINIYKPISTRKSKVFVFLRIFQLRERRGELS